MSHAQEALGALSKSRDWLEDEEFARADLAVKRAQVHATLALAEQQRIANIIAWGTANGTEPPAEVACLIVEAIGLGDTA